MLNTNNKVIPPMLVCKGCQHDECFCTCDKGEPKETVYGRKTCPICGIKYSGLKCNQMHEELGVLSTYG